jgi:acetolactate decarboxylase
MTELTAALDRSLPDRSLFSAIRIEGTFPYLKVRSPPAQAKPYPPLAEALTRQAVFEYRNVTGTVVGFFTPAPAGGLNVAGYHLHFIAADRGRGGHVLDITTAGNTAELDATPRYTVIFSPEGGLS